MRTFMQIPIINWLLLVTAIIVCVALPIILTIINILNLIKKKKFHPAIIDILTFVLGIGLTALLFNIMSFRDYTATTGYGTYSPIAFDSIPTIITILIIGVISYAIIRIKKVKWPSFVIIISMAGTLICSIMMLIFIVQISNSLVENNIGLMPFFILFPLNYLLCTIRAKREVIQKYKEETKEEKKSSISDSSNWEILSVIFAIIIFLVITVILTLFGQRPDELINAFTQTKGWVLSIH